MHNINLIQYSDFPLIKLNCLLKVSYQTWRQIHIVQSNSQKVPIQNT